MFNSLEELCITRMAAVNSFARGLKTRERSVYSEFTHRLAIESTIYSCTFFKDINS